jgi:hypothetical protein
MAYNVLGLCEEADLEAQMFNLAQMFIRIPNVQFSTEPAFLQNPCCMPFFMVSSLSVDLGRYQNYFCFGLFGLLCE